ncbi:conserved protein of unknown function [Cupriavidus neocaledonicus]|uniref:Uncharacterized protein n=1 Tax=Cupriavidus neocaledonicus TaxID=1040979 RepID=A0A375H7X4_9BURK|nr:hypothetical protein CBM2605_A160064 [Cupriavidus neocaledonicus]SPD46968.1 conserved protein of unknown function [Cupriavidus neocaledonicus]
MEELLDALEVDMDLGVEPGLGLLEHLHAAAPWQELGIVLHAGDQVVHLRGGVTEQDGFMDVCHVRGNLACGHAARAARQACACAGGWFARIPILADPRAPRHPAMRRCSEPASIHPTASYPHA